MAEESAAPAAEKPAPKRTRRHTARFVLVFVGAVLLLLTGYRYAIHTELNDWYLFQVARHTTWALTYVGDSATLEEPHIERLDPRTVRGSLAAWRRGEATPTAADLEGASRERLTPWEAWSYRAQQSRMQGHRGLMGPRVSFVFRRGLNDEIRAAEAALESLRQNPDTSQGAIDDARANLRELFERQQARIDAGEADRNRSYIFPFIVIPDCGAIEVMAIFFAAVIAFPTLWWKRLAGLAAGLPIMYALNIFRLSCLAIIGALDAGGAWFKFSHEYLWQAIYIVFVVIVWLAWLEYVVRLRGRRKDG